jgi:hypothetical protein
MSNEPLELLVGGLKLSIHQDVVEQPRLLNATTSTAANAANITESEHAAQGECSTHTNGPDVTWYSQH